MNPKKLLSLALALTMGLSLTACGGGKAPSASPSEAAGSAAPAESAAGSSDLAYVKDKGVLVVGITEFEPMDYQDKNGSWIGFDADMARAFAGSLGVECQFQVIDWDNKVLELDGKNIDVVWNGMTLTDGVMSAMACTNAYCKNAQVVVVRGQ